MFRRSRTARIKENAVSASELAMRLAQDKRFRKRLISAVKHSSEASRRTRRNLSVTGAVRRFAGDQALQAELRSARRDLRRAYGRLDAKRRAHRLRKLTVLAGLASLAALPQLRRRARLVIAKAPKDPRQLRSVANRIRSDGSATTSSRPRALDDLTKDELYARAQDADIPGRSEMTKEELIDALRATS